MFWNTWAVSFQRKPLAWSSPPFAQTNVQNTKTPITIPQKRTAPMYSWRRRVRRARGAAMASSKVVMDPRARRDGDRSSLARVDAHHHRAHVAAAALHRPEQRAAAAVAIHRVGGVGH